MLKELSSYNAPPTVSSVSKWLDYYLSQTWLPFAVLIFLKAIFFKPLSLKLQLKQLIPFLMLLFAIGIIFSTNSHLGTTHYTRLLGNSHYIIILTIATLAVGYYYLDISFSFVSKNQLINRFLTSIAYLVTFLLPFVLLGTGMVVPHKLVDEST